MFNLFKKTIYDIDPPAFGLDISDLSLKVVVLEQKKNYAKLASFNSIAIPPGIITNGEILDVKKAASVITDAIKNSKGKKIRSRYVVASLPEEKAFIRVIQLPKMKLDEVEKAVAWEAENNIPMSAEEAYLDWQVISPLVNHLDHVDVLIIAVPRKLVDRYVEVLRAADFIPRVLEVESVAVVRSVVAGEMAEQPFLIIDLGQVRTSFIVFSGRTLRFTSSLEISGRVFTDAIAREFKVDASSAEELKQKHGLLKKDNEGGLVFDCLIPALTDLIEQIKNYLEFYQSHAKHEHLKASSSPSPISKIILCGGGAALKGIDSFFGLNLKLPVEIANPWVNILRPPLREIPELPYEQSLRYTTALGLALRGVRKY